VEVLVIIGGNPAYKHSHGLRLISIVWLKCLCAFIHGLYKDETAELCHCTCRDHYLESWVHTLVYGTVTIVQP